MAENIHKGHRERTRKKFLESRFIGFAEHEKLELLLFYARPMIDTNGIAHRLINKFGSIGEVFDASPEQLMEVEGVNEATAVLIKLVPEMIKECALSRGERVPMRDHKDVCEFFRYQFIGYKNEIVKAAFIDDRLRLVRCVDITEGGPDAVHFDVRSIVAKSLKYNCTNVVLAHNHPNGDAMPSDGDIRVTVDIHNMLKTMGIRLLDHVVVAGGNAVSLKESGAFAML